MYYTCMMNRSAVAVELPLQWQTYLTRPALPASIFSSRFDALLLTSTSALDSLTQDRRMLRMGNCVKFKRLRRTP